MPQEQSQKSGEPPIGECAVCGEPVTQEDPGTLQFSPSSGVMANVHTRCQSAPAAGSLVS
jgi:hypothetical protein